MQWANLFIANETLRSEALSAVDDNPLICQLASCNRDELLHAAKLVCEFPHVAGIDLNLGCPQPCAQQSNIGAYLARDWKLASELVRALRSAVPAHIVVSAKIRVEAKLADTLRLAKALEAAGADFVAVHGRTLEQRRSGDVSWTQIRAVVDALDIPVVANGGCSTAADIDRCLRATAAAGYMSAEPLLVRPQLFAEYFARFVHHDASRVPTYVPTELARRYLSLAREHTPAHCRVSWTREHLLHMLGFRRRSFHHFERIGERDMFLKLNRAKELRWFFQREFSKTTGNIAEAIEALDKLHQIVVADPPPSISAKKRKIEQ